MLVLICYDIADDRRRAKAAQVVEGFGDRVQASVYECRLDQARLTALRASLTQLVDARSDCAHIYVLCERDAADVLHDVGHPPVQDTYTWLL